MLSIIKAKNFDEAIEIANDSEYGLTGAVFCRDRYKIEKAKKELLIGNLYINRKCTGAIVGVHPFGGFNINIINREKGDLHFRVISRGKSAHGSRVWEGINAIENIIDFYNDISLIFYN